MKRILIAAALAAAGCAQAIAADLPMAPPPPPPRAPAAYIPVEPPFTWTGVYFGLNGGYGSGASWWGTTAAPTTASNTFGIMGGLVGGTLGANYQWGGVVLGVETDFDWANLSGSSAAADPGCASCKTSDDWLGTARARVGFAWNRVMFFGTGGAAYGDMKASTPLGGTTTTQFGWTGGGGLEYALTPNWTVKADYLYVSLSNGSCAAAICGMAANPWTVRFTANLARIGVNYKFGGW
jgi:outer membrane immunogenic protein